jgi:hypothetical protein
VEFPEEAVVGLLRVVARWVVEEWLWIVMVKA